VRKLHGPTANAVAPDNDPGDPDARAELFQDDVARHFEQEVTPEESAGRHAVSRGIEAEILVHGERGETDIDAIEIAQEINQDGQWQQPPIDLAHGRSFDVHWCLPSTRWRVGNHHTRGALCLY
jgi:hypothetical protein